MNRRRFLAVAGATATSISLAGCADPEEAGTAGGVGETDGTTEEELEETTEGGEETTTEGEGLTTTEDDEETTTEGEETTTEEGEETTADGTGTATETTA